MPGTLSQGAVLGDRVIELEPGQAGAYLNRAVIRVSLKERAGAIADLERFLELVPEHPDAAQARTLLERVRAGN